MSLSSLLPGIREIRTPLVAGYIWLVFAYLVAGAPSTLSDAPGPIQEIAELLDSFGSLAKGIAVSFVAYLVGSVSEDAFSRVLPTAVGRASVVFRRFGFTSFRSLDARSVQSQIRESVDRLAQAPEDARKRDFLRGQLVDDLTAILASVREGRVAGASESEKPEALRPIW